MIDRTIESELIRHLKVHLPPLKALLDESSSHWGYEDPIFFRRCLALVTVSLSQSV